MNGLGGNNLSTTDRSLLLLMAEVNHGFPLEIGFAPAEVSSGGSFSVDGTSQVEVLDDHSGTEVKVAIDDSLQIFIGESLIEE